MTRSSGIDRPGCVSSHFDLGRGEERRGGEVRGRGCAMKQSRQKKKEANKHVERIHAYPAAVFKKRRLYCLLLEEIELL